MTDDPFEPELSRLLAGTSPAPRGDAQASLDAMIARIVALPQEPAPPTVVTSLWTRRAPQLRYAACLLAALTGFTIGALDSRGPRIPSDLLDLAFGAPSGDFDVQ